MEKIQIIVLDMDGTLLQEDHKSISERTKRALSAAMERGIEIVPATGRVQSMLPEELLRIGGIRYAITSNGAAVRELKGNRLLYGKLIPVDTVRRIIRFFEPYDLFCQLYCGGCMYVEERNMGRTNEIPFHPSFVEEICRRLTPVENFEALFRKYPEGVEKFNLPHLEPELRERAWRELSASPALALTSAVDGNMEINAGGCNKGDALKHLCETLKISPEHVMAVGDNGNDLEMLSYASYSFAMSNGTEEAKAAARYVTDSNLDDGVAKAIESYVL